jgi:hypothetical protein
MPVNNYMSLEEIISGAEAEIQKAQQEGRSTVEAERILRRAQELKQKRENDPSFASTPEEFQELIQQFRERADQIDWENS